MELLNRVRLAINGYATLSAPKSTPEYEKIKNIFWHIVK